MSVELAEFHEIYFAECLENIALLKAAVTRMTVENDEDEIMMRAYRAAHSIKGASGIFGFHAVADSARALQIMLEQIRQSKREPNSALRAVLVQSVVRLENKLEAARVDQALDMARIDEQREILRREQETYADYESWPAGETAHDLQAKNRI